MILVGGRVTPELGWLAAGPPFGLPISIFTYPPVILTMENRSE